jgi:hypothetical protein
MVRRRSRCPCILVMDNRAQEMHTVVTGGRPQHSSSSLAGIVLALSISSACY